ncbi:DUF4231 domain-containing protein [Nonomuraea sp. GTA35]|uniref:DUF4231 domain-containing protein n=1 Tax=Nonomuraea sp. GTA35 TaxID=1676746 RepID=UPI0035C14DEF
MPEYNDTQIPYVHEAVMDRYRQEAALRRVRRRRGFFVSAGIGSLVVLAAGILFFIIFPRETGSVVPGTASASLALVCFIVAVACLVRSRFIGREIRQREKKLAQIKANIRPENVSEADEVELAAHLAMYHAETLAVINEYRDNATRYRKIHNRFQSIVIIGSIVTTAVTSAAGQLEYLRVVAPFISILVGISAGMTGYFKFRERSINLQRTADDIEHEYTAVWLGIDRYRNIDDELGRYVEFAERVEHLKAEQRKVEQQLEQPPELANHAAAPQLHQ